MDPLHFPWRYLLQIFCFLAFAVWAFRKGGEPEKACAAAFVAMVLADRLYHLIVTSSLELETVDIWHFSLDLTILVILVLIALQANRIYPMGLAALQLIAVNAHFARDAFSQITPFAYALTVIVPSYGQLLVLCLGMCAHVRRSQRVGLYRDWRSSPLPV